MNCEKTEVQTCEEYKHPLNLWSLVVFKHEHNTDQWKKTQQNPPIIKENALFSDKTCLILNTAKRFPNIKREYLKKKKLGAFQKLSAASR